MSTIIYLAIIIFTALWVHKDAKKFREKGVDLNPSIWSTLVFLFWGIAFPLYLILRLVKYKKLSLLGNPPLQSVSKIHSWWIVIVFIGIPFAIILFFIVSSLMGAKQKANEVKVNTEQVEQVSATEEAERRKRTEEQQVVFEYSGDVGRYGLINGTTDGSIASLVLNDSSGKNPPILLIFTQETKAYKMLNGNKIKINTVDLTSIKKDANVSVKYYKDKNQNNKRIVKEITLNSGY